MNSQLAAYEDQKNLQSRKPPLARDGIRTSKSLNKVGMRINDRPSFSDNFKGIAQALGREDNCTTKS